MGLRGIGANPKPAALRRRQLNPDRHKLFACELCATEFVSTRIDAKFCSNACRQKYYRALPVPRRKVKSKSHRATPIPKRPKRRVLPGGFTPIDISDEMIDAILTTHGTQEVYVGCLRGCCRKPKGKHGRCAMCSAYMDAAGRLRCLANVPHWTCSGLPDEESPPAALQSNAKAQAAWRRAWQLRLELIEAAQRKLGEA
jgi:hypothetical protein